MPAQSTSKLSLDHSPGARLTFPREFELHWWQSFDRRFVMTLIGSLLVHFALIVYFINNPPRHDVGRVQEQFARLVLDKAARETKFVETPQQSVPVAPPEAEPAASPPAAATAATRAPASRPGRRGSLDLRPAEPAEATGPGGGGEIAGNSGPVAGGRRSRAAISQQVGNQGLLGLLTSSSGLATGESAADILGSHDANTNLDQALAGVTGIKRAGSGAEAESGAGAEGSGVGSGGPGKGRVRGGRDTGTGNIDALVSGLGEGKAKGVSRSGELVINSEKPLIEAEEGQVGGAGRNADAIQAVVAKHSPAIEYCYQRAIKRDPNLKGKIVVRFVITPQGTVESATIVSKTVNNPEVEDCILSRIRRWDDFGAIDPQKGNTTVRQVYTFGY
ncbi:MAG: TonB family protein [candidate division KSB1 bacterium]|nr:TonB family protein [candidate division KSB1 bacterium]MDZ7273065.1 TonB family protein [candidate division KSB1 bacterium]MDZ7285168.1 TonB family protein [candidate division KSB1 bacterium]MDZ7298200.1 TonB family protein [candidate division KSB1 bacterium]MDZ7306874.1 TonB family protein [candidate division KSB1 bacterium]